VVDVGDAVEEARELGLVMGVERFGPRRADAPRGRRELGPVP
jgi:hypothetical protein